MEVFHDLKEVKIRVPKLWDSKYGREKQQVAARLGLLADDAAVAVFADAVVLMIHSDKDGQPDHRVLWIRTAINQLEKEYPNLPVKLLACYPAKLKENYPDLPVIGDWNEPTCNMPDVLFANEHEDLQVMSETEAVKLGVPKYDPDNPNHHIRWSMRCLESIIRANNTRQAAFDAKIRSKQTVINDKRVSEGNSKRNDEQPAAQRLLDLLKDPATGRLSS